MMLKRQQLDAVHQGLKVFSILREARFARVYGGDGWAVVAELSCFCRFERDRQVVDGGRRDRATYLVRRPPR